MRYKKAKNQKIFTYSPGKSLAVRLRGKRLANGSISLYLDYYQSYTKTDEGKIRTKRGIEYLKLYLTANPTTPDERIKNDEVLNLAQDIRSKRESDIKHKQEGLIAPYRKRLNFFDYCQAYLNSYQKKDTRMIVMAINQFKEYTKQTYLTPTQITPAYVKGFLDYLQNKYKGETPGSVFARFKKILTAATDEGLFTESPAIKITCNASESVTKAILTKVEILELAKADCPNPEVKRAFLFSLNTGLRFVDVTTLKFKHIANEQVRKSQQKTGREVVIDLNPIALALIGTPGKPDEFVFNLPSHTGALKSLKAWVKNAKINKNITWHCARHSFATNLLINKTDIKTVGNLLGHSKLEHTQKYTHIVDELKKQAVNSL
jgi:integrase/recombinase XerD